MGGDIRLLARRFLIQKYNIDGGTLEKNAARNGYSDYLAWAQADPEFNPDAMEAQHAQLEASIPGTPLNQAKAEWVAGEIARQQAAEVGFVPQDPNAQYVQVSDNTIIPTSSGYDLYSTTGQKFSISKPSPTNTVLPIEQVHQLPSRIDSSGNLTPVPNGQGSLMVFQNPNDYRGMSYNKQWQIQNVNVRTPSPRLSENQYRYIFGESFKQDVNFGADIAKVAAINLGNVYSDTGKGIVYLSMPYAAYETTKHIVGFSKTRDISEFRPEHNKEKLSAAIAIGASLSPAVLLAAVGYGGYSTTKLTAIALSAPTSENIGKALASGILTGVGLRVALKETIMPPVNIKLNPNYRTPEDIVMSSGAKEVKGLKLTPANTEPISLGGLKGFAGREVVTVHTTFSKQIPKNGEILLQGFADKAGWRQNIDSLGFYKSLPTNQGTPQAYLGYIGIGKGPKSSEIKFSLTEPENKLLIESAKVEYVPPRSGETPLQYNQRIFGNSKYSGRTLLPVENIFRLSVERQAITTTQFTGVGGQQYGGSLLRVTKTKVFTYYQEPKPIAEYLPNFLKPLATKYTRLNIYRSESRPITSKFEVIEKPRINMKKYSKELESSYGKRTVSASSIASKSLSFRPSSGARSSISTPISRLSNPSSLHKVASSSPAPASKHSSLIMRNSVGSSSSVPTSKQSYSSIMRSMGSSSSLGSRPSYSSIMRSMGSNSIGISAKHLRSSNVLNNPKLPKGKSQSTLYKITRRSKYNPSLAGAAQRLRAPKGMKSGELTGLEVRGI